jgi:hypothetical protein
MQDRVEGDGVKHVGPDGDKKHDARQPGLQGEERSPEEVELGSMIFAGARLAVRPEPRSKGMRGKRREPGGASTASLPMNREFVTTTEAARYCGFRTPGGLRKAWYAMLVFPVGRRGGRRTLMWEKRELDRFLRGEPLKKSQAEGVLMPPQVAPADEEGP